MTQKVRSTLLCDGSSDTALLPVIRWVLQREGGNMVFQPTERADLSRLQHRPRRLWERIACAIEYYPCDLLFVHRDSESQPPESRYAEIDRAVARCRHRLPTLRPVPIVPVRMTEAWLMGDEVALRTAAGRPRGTNPLPMPGLRSLEGIANPKAMLYDLLRRANQLEGRHLRRFKPEKASLLVARFTPSFERLLCLPAFARFVQDTTRACSELAAQQRG